MRYEYETIIICKPDEYERSIVNTSSLCQKYTGDKYKIKKDILGVKKLAYKLRDKYTEGYYAIFRWIGTPEDVTDVERHLRIDDDVLKFMTVKVEADEDEFSLEELTEDDVTTTEQDKPDALDVLLGLAHY